MTVGISHPEGNLVLTPRSLPSDLSRPKNLRFFWSRRLQTLERVNTLPRRASHFTARYSDRRPCNWPGVIAVVMCLVAALLRERILSPVWSAPSERLVECPCLGVWLSFWCCCSLFALACARFACAGCTRLRFGLVFVRCIVVGRLARPPPCVASEPKRKSRSCAENTWSARVSAQ